MKHEDEAADETEKSRKKWTINARKFIRDARTFLKMKTQVGLHRVSRRTMKSYSTKRDLHRNMQIQ